MAFTSYADADDLEKYLESMLRDFWNGDKTDADDSLRRASRTVNEFLKGLDRIPDDEIPVDVEDDGEYAEVLIMLTVYEAVWAKVKGVLAGEAFQDHWAWVPATIRDLRSGIREGDYRFGGDEESSTKSAAIKLTRSST